MKTLAQRIAEDRLTVTSIPFLRKGPKQVYGVEVHRPGQPSLRLREGFPSDGVPTVEGIMRFLLTGCRKVQGVRDSAMPLDTYLLWTRRDTALFDLLGSERHDAYIYETEW